MLDANFLIYYYRSWVHTCDTVIVRAVRLCCILTSLLTICACVRTYVWVLAQGIETVRRDQCPVTAKMQEKALVSERAN